MITEIRSTNNASAELLYKVATAGLRVPLLDTLVSCGRLESELNPTDICATLYYHWRSGPSFGIAKFEAHGQTIEVRWASDQKSSLIRVEVENPTYETYMTISKRDLPQMSVRSASGKIYTGHDLAMD